MRVRICDSGEKKNQFEPMDDWPGGKWPKGGKRWKGKKKKKKCVKTRDDHDKTEDTPRLQRGKKGTKSKEVKKGGTGVRTRLKCNPEEGVMLVVTGEWGPTLWFWERKI